MEKKGAGSFLCIMNYIRFLKSPPKRVLLNDPFQIIWTIQTDLADSFCLDSYRVECLVTTLDGIPYDGHVVAPARPEYDYYATGGYCKLEMRFTSRPPGGGMKAKVMLRIIARSAASDEWISETSSFAQFVGNEELIVPVWSAPVTLLEEVTVKRTEKLRPSSQAARLKQDADTMGRLQQCERRFPLEDGEWLEITEDAGESIARHIWDAGIFLCYFLQTLKSHPSRRLSITSDTTILELGYGTGLVGLYASRLFRPTSVYLTDLAEALPLLEQNTAGASAVLVQELDWSTAAMRRTIFPARIDFILASDVLYNAGSHTALLSAMTSMAGVGTTVLLAYKQRHEEERGFWEAAERMWKVEVMAEGGECRIYALEKR
ncbi:putative methyltransferase-domain-containing protein [Endogone sp. FLAS-F59071]|nr:putative methyltransferase-domain-containing protein [Endogone sp. FLAS-F59071]RUS18354.1 putative methyltransferase-domain-containing protein [Endogone sp. FLAS-F59071]|eukprot:RUS17430.1 putative methyltransferase-domain-containing protein [Endogone sp. FLAS-F59071]